MILSIELTRPDDLLHLRLEGRNLRLDRAEGEPPGLVVDDPAQPAFLIVHFPPQAIAEGAYYEATVGKALDADLPPDTKPQPPPTTIEAPDEPGVTPVRMAHGSRLVFKVPAEVRLPFTTAGLLDWSALELSVNGIAAIGPDPTPAEIAAAPVIAPPTDTETALELPYKLIVSPNADVRWGHRLAPFTSRGRTELWHTQLQLAGANGAQDLTAQHPAALRAIWSEDYGVRALQDPDLKRAAMAPDDRHQIVVKTSAFHGYEEEATLGLSFGMGAHGASLATARSPIGGAGFELKYWVPFVPQPFFADQLMLSALGGWLRSRGQWSVVRKAKPIFRFEALDVGRIAVGIGDIGRDIRLAAPAIGDRRLLAEPRAPIGIELLAQDQPDEVLDLSEWLHTATQGRDHYVQLVYEGELLPFHHRAALVKVTERKFKEKGGRIVANLFQRNFIVVRDPEKRFSDSDRGMPFKRVLITRTVTPDIADPDYPPSVVGFRSFWVDVMQSPSPTDRVRFGFPTRCTDPGGEEHALSIPMIFLSRAADPRQPVLDAYNDSSSLKKLAERSVVAGGQKILFAARGASASDNALLATRTLTFALAGEAPRLLKAEVDIPQVQQLLGKPASATIRLYPGFVDSGFDAGAGVFAEVVTVNPASGDPFATLSPTTLGVEFTSDQAGGFATPNLGVSTLTRGRGPLAGTVTDALADTFNPKSFFPAGTASLFGTFDLFDLLLGSGLADGAPKLQTHAEDIPGGKLLVATLDWTPKVDNRDLGIAAFKKFDATQLIVHGRIEKPMAFDASGAPVAAEAKSSFEGTLSAFTVSVLKAVEISVKQFGFATRSGAKPDVTVQLDPAQPLKFTGDLQFVEELRNAIPPDLFGKGPSLDLTPTGVRAGFSFALPPIAVGVFALKDIALGAALSLPFLDGRPTFDFNVSERPHPFLLSLGIFGGGGFFHLQLDTAGLKVVEAAFEFGATASVDLGVASGGVHIMAGIYFKLERKEPGTDLAPTLTGYLRMGGYLSVIGLIKISLEFVLSFTYDRGRDKAYGRATLTVQVEIAFFSTSVEVTVERAFGGSSGDPTFGQLFSAAETWSEYAEAFA
jgi:hypothetical protein